MPVNTTDTSPVVTAGVLHEWAMEYAMVHGSVPLARVHIRRTLTMWQWRGDVQDAVLVGSELLTNAINHGRIVGHLLECRLVALDDGSVLIDVSDPLPAFPNFGRLQPDDSESEQGRGLFVIRALGGRISWFLRGDSGKTTRVQMAP
ncbi:ATP-binding protein [Streptomyces sp. SDT5-1]|uniref:ATP-binding protein n=1 Tax=Streptomyces sp. SDT5-1 TaxID=3406418 RepID=UPI003FD5589C